VLDQEIGKDLSLRTELPPAAEGVVGIAFDEALIGNHSTGVNVDADEASVAGGTKSDGGAGIVAEDVEANGQFDFGANGATGGSRGGDSFGSDVCFSERNVTEIFDENRVSAAAFVGLGISDGSRDYLFQVTLPAWRAGERSEVDNTDKKFVTLVKGMEQSVKWG
jgi:hypothetical protein